MVGLPPLEHFHLAPESVAVLGDDREVSVAQIYIVARLSRDVNQVVVMHVVRLAGVHSLARCSPAVNQLQEADGLSFIAPENVHGEEGEEGAKKD